LREIVNERLLKHRPTSLLKPVPLASLATLHPQVRDLVEHAPGGFLAQDLSAITGASAEMMCMLSPIVAVAISQGRYQRLAGHRTYQVARAVLGPDAEVLALVLTGRITAEYARLVGAFSVSGWPLLSSLDASGVHQIDAVLADLQPGYRRASAGRPTRDADEPARAPWVLTSAPMSSARLARICGVAPSTIRRGRAAAGGGDE
jgi:hypothetical protein